MTKQTKTPQRMCVACRQMFSKTDLIRLVLTEDGTAKVDKSGKMNGRGVYLCKNSECWQRARKNKGFARAHGFVLTDELLEQLGATLD